MVGTAHIDTFARDRLPPSGLWPEFLLNRPEISYPARLNAAAELVDTWIAAGRGERPCLLHRDGDWSYARLADTVDRIARLLTEDHGLVPGNRVLLRGPNTPMLAACWLAVIKAGGIAVATMPLLRSAELAFIVDRVRIRIALCDGAYLEDMERAAEDVNGPLTVVPFNRADDPQGLEARIAAKEPGFTAVDTAADDVAVIAFTSGTTGHPKATAHFHRDLLAVADLSPRSQLSTTGDDVFCGTPSIAFAYGLGGLLLFPLRVGAATVLLDRPTPERLATAIVRHRATLCFTVPTVYRAMLARLDEGTLEAASFASLRACISAGEPLPVTAFDAWYRFTGLTILDTLGTTEMLNCVLATPPDAVRPGATGKPVAGYECRVVDEDGHPVPAGQIGRLAVRGPTGCRYLDDPRQRAYVQDGWNLTGDAFHMDEDGYFWYHGRTDDLIVSGGYKISGLEIEDVLLHHDAVEECAVVAAPDPMRGTIPKAFVVIRHGVHPGPGLTEDLQEFVKRRIAPYKYPRAVEFLEALPRTETGKIQRYKLRDRECRRIQEDARLEEASRVG
ncbi:benzoate-CoA ligase family protein [Azospirillum halopraeferens]|uniref:benzoate-CoA ligase family protein n=1 Tax=Azospirillum halopraeferens TaxID=34010 RepID=UPI00040D91D5|nr:benzoate-CoA ligase family protein [Azospirillum halopraeferens]